MHRVRYCVGILTLLLFTGQAAAQSTDFGDRYRKRLQEKASADRETVLPSLGYRYVDTHAHLVGQGPGAQRIDFKMAMAGPSDSALKEMDRVGIGVSILMPTPQSYQDANRYDLSDLKEALSRHPGRFVLMGGGGTLNAMIHKSHAEGKLDEETRALFARIAEELIQDGAVGFGEMSATHLSHAKVFNAFHPYEWAPADHPLFLLLSDIAARHDVPIDLHMDMAPEDTPPIPALRHEPNPEIIPANLNQFARLLAHNRKTRIVLAHAGWDTTGKLSPMLLRRMLSHHPNLYLSLKLQPGVGFPKTRAMTDSGELKPAWLQLIQDFPDRFLIGSDYFHGAEWQESLTPGEGKGDWTHRFLSALPPELARQVAIDNPQRIYRLPH